MLVGVVLPAIHLHSTCNAVRYLCIMRANVTALGVPAKKQGWLLLAAATAGEPPVLLQPHNHST